MADESRGADSQLHLHETLDRIYQMHNFNAWIYSLIQPYLGPRVVEVGCGVGSFTEFLSEKGRQVIAADIEPEYLKRVEERYRDHPRVRVVRYDVTQPIEGVLPVGQADSVVCMNVIEHIEDDLSAYRHLVDLLAPGGRSLILVPAFQWLFGSMDVEYQHYRRYHRRPLEQLSREAGLEIDHTFYVNMAGIPGWWFSGRVTKRKTLPALGLKLYHSLVPLFKWIEQVTGPPIGLSLIVIGRKPVS